MIASVVIICEKAMDRRVKPGDDAGGCRATIDNIKNPGLA
jgi:hypothetical protein